MGQLDVKDKFGRTPEENAYAHDAEKPADAAGKYLRYLRNKQTTFGYSVVH